MPPTNSSIIGTIQNEFKKEAWVNITSALPSIGSNIFKAPPVTSPPGTYRILLPSNPNEINQFVCKFYATGGSGKHAQVRFLGVRRQINTGFSSDYALNYLAELDLVTGTATANTGSFTSGGPYNLVERANIIDDQSHTPPGLRLIGTVAGGWVDVMFDATGYSEIWVLITNVDSTGGGAPTTVVGFLWSTL